MLKMHSTRWLVIVIILFVLLACSSTSKVATLTPEPTFEIPTPAPTHTSAPSPTPTEISARVSVTKNTNCRTGPSTDYAVKTTLPAGTEVEVLGRNTGSDFYYVQDPNDPGEGCWIWSQLAAIISGEIVMLPVFTPAALPMPVVVQPTAAPACSVTTAIYINNTTGGTLTLYLSGPAKYTFYVSSGNQTINVCNGTYSYTAYGCGGAVRTGSMSSGDTHDFWCE